MTETCDTCISGHAWGSLHDYQVVAREYLRGRDRAALMLDMGLGKTASSLSALEPRHLPVLVVAPKKVADETWDVEQEIWRPDLTLRKAVGEPAARHAALTSDADIVVISRDNMADVLKHKRTTPFRTLILDELSGYKGRGTRWKTARDIIKKHRIPHVWGLTGTPAPNGYLDLWPQIALLDNGERLGRNITTYRGRYFMPGRQLPNGTIIEWNMRPEAEQHIKELIEDICLSMSTEGRIKLPDTTFNKLAVELPPAVRKAYRTLSDELAVDLRDVFDGEIHTAGNAAVLTSRLSQMTSGFIYVDDAEMHGNAYTRLHREKPKSVREVVESDHVGGVLVFYRFTPELDMLKEELGELVHTIDEPDIVKRWNRGEIPVLLSHPASAGHGLNLQYGGHTIVWTTPTWDLEHWDQANKRLARQGQKHPVVIHTVLANKSIDHLVLKRCFSKSDVQQDLLRFLESPV